MTNQYLVNATATRIPLASESVHTCITSPPYWNLRRYDGITPTLWPAVTYTPMAGLPPATIPAMTACLGNEPDPLSYVGHLVLVFREVRRTLRDDGTLWLNISSSYANSRSYQVQDSKHVDVGNNMPSSIPNGYKPTDLIMIPAMVAQALQADGWYLRNDPQWIKDSAMPESVKSRMTLAHEYLFLLAKSKKYFYDADAVRVDAPYGGDVRKSKTFGKSNNNDRNDGGRYFNGSNGRNRRTSDVWRDSITAAIDDHRAHIRYLKDLRDNHGLKLDADGNPVTLHVNPEGYSGRHYACFPRALVRPLIKASTSEAGVCAVCGAQWERVTESNTNYVPEYNEKTVSEPHHHSDKHTLRAKERNTLTLGFRPTCDHHDASTVPATVLDPFVGSGTTLLVARELGRRGIGCDLSHTYLVEQATKRLLLDDLKRWTEGAPQEAIDSLIEELPLFAY